MTSKTYAKPGLYPDLTELGPEEAREAAREYFLTYERVILRFTDINPWPSYPYFFGVFGFKPLEGTNNASSFCKPLLKQTASLSRKTIYRMANEAIRGVPHETQIRIIAARDARYGEIGMIQSFFETRITAYINALRRSGDALLLSDFVNAWEKGIQPPND